MSEFNINSMIGDNGNLTISIGGKVNTGNAKQVGNEIDNILKNSDHNKLILDISDLKYISSAGIRAIMLLQRQGENLEIENASPEVFEIFEVTGINTVIPISKK